MGKLYDLARMTTATTGTGTITLGAAVAPYLTFAQAGVADGDTVDYAIKDGTSNSEIGTGVYTASGTTLTRNPTKSTNGNSAISLSGTAEVFISPRAETLNVEVIRQYNALLSIYQSKLFAGYRRFINAFADGYKASDGILDGSSANYVVVTASGYVAPTTAYTTQTNPNAADSSGALSGYTVADESFALTNGGTFTSIGIYNSVGVNTFTLKILKQNSAGNYDVVFVQAGNPAYPSRFDRRKSRRPGPMHSRAWRRRLRNRWHQAPDLAGSPGYRRRSVPGVLPTPVPMRSRAGRRDSGSVFRRPPSPMFLPAMPRHFRSCFRPAAAVIRSPAPVRVLTAISKRGCRGRSMPAAGRAAPLRAKRGRPQRYHRTHGPRRHCTPKHGRRRMRRPGHGRR